MLIAVLAAHASLTVSYPTVSNYTVSIGWEIVTCLEQLTVVFLAPLEVVAKAVAYTTPVRERHLALPAVMDYSNSVNNHSELSKQE